MSDVFLVKNPLDPYEREHFEHDGPIIDLLQEIAPDGFDMPIRVFVNGEEIDLYDLDREVSGDDITAIIVTPGFLGITAAMVIQAVVSIAISIVLSLLFAPKAPGDQSRDENPTYNINVLRNEARLGKPIPVVYGDLWVTPDYASKPYRFYDSATFDQYLDVLMCLGCGEFEQVTAADLKIGNTTLNDTTAVSIKQFQLGAARGGINSHKGKFGNIQKQLWAEGWNGDAPVFVEAMYTSPEVDDWQFSNDNSTTTVTATANVTWKKGLSQTGADIFIMEIDRADFATLFVYGSRNITIATSTLGNDGSYRLGYIDDDGVSAKIDIPIFYTTKTIALGADTISVTSQKSSNSLIAGPFWTTPNAEIKTNYIYLDFVAPRGIYWQGDKHVEYIADPAEHPKFKIEIYSSAGALVMTKDWTCPHTGHPDPVRITLPISIQTGGSIAPPDRYKVKVTAQYKITDSQRLQNKMSLAGVKSSLVGYNGQDSYGDSTMLAVRIKATNGIATQSQNQLRVRTKRRITKLDGTVGTTSNPADIAHDILVNDDYGASQSDSTTGTDIFVDRASFDDCHRLWDNYKTDGTNYPSFNGSFATANTVWDALQSTLSVAVAKPMMHHGQVKLSRDSIKPTRAFLFNANNIVLDSLTANYSLSSENEEDHVEVEYRDNDLMEPAYKIYPDSLVLGHTPRSPYKVKLFGCTNAAYAAKYARLVYNRRLYQRKSTSFDTEMDGMLPMVGDRILVSSPQVRWGVSGAVRFAKKSAHWVLTLDSLPDWVAMAKPGVKSYIVLTDIEGRVSNRTQITPLAAKDERVVLQSEPTYPDGTPFNIDISGARDPARFAILLSSGENGRDMEITRIEHRGGTEFGIEAIHYEVLQDNTGHKMYDGVPEHMRQDFDGSDLI